MDDVDRKILRVLQEDATIAVADLAKKVGLSHTPCWRRVKQMEEAGIIRRAVLLDPELLGLPINVLANVKLKAHDEETLEAFEKAAAQQPAIVDCFIMGGDSDYALRIVVGSIEEYERLLKKTLLHFPGVAAMNSHFALKCVKNTTKLPI
ncbi:MAG TPA: Lrp/AsnC family transcriptional regulator [Rhizomicrobium sp.]|jgi:Lrp/AsnC family transcriptional regulator|nr:Lrp/AsnC family transcriptional regulator [Rhizomicrobium sp.]